MSLSQQTMSMLRRCTGSMAPLSSLSGFSSVAGAPRCEKLAVPAGHRDSDLSAVASNIGLNRRRDLTMRGDLRLFSGQDGSSKTLADVFKGKKVILVGFPGGPICTEKHVPGYVEAMDMLKRKGVDNCLCVTVNDTDAVAALNTKMKLTGTGVDLMADPKGNFMRLLGLELDSGAGPRCQRFAAIVEDGILLKLQIEKTPGELKVSDAESMCELWKAAFNVQ